MSFLSVAFLAALPLIAAPLLLHLFDRRRHAPIPWAAMQFIVAAEARRTSARRLKQWLLILLRTLAIAALVLALARPMLSGGWFGGRDRTELILVLDNSMSMTRSVAQQTLWDIAATQAAAEIDQLTPGDRVRVMTSAPFPVWIQPSSLRVVEESKGNLTQSIKDIRATLGRSDMLAALMTAVQSTAHPSVKNRRIVIIGDAQANDWSIDNEPDWKRFQDTLTQSPIATKLSFVNLLQPDSQKASTAKSVTPPDSPTSQVPLNVAVDRIDATHTLVGVHHPITFRALLHNYGTVSAAERTVHWKIDGQPQAESVVDSIDPDASQETQWIHSFEKPGAYRVAGSFDGDDPLPPDNVASVVIEVVNRIPILMVESSIEFSDIQQDSFFVNAALGWAANQALDESAVYAPTVVSPQKFSSLDLHQFRAVVIPNLVSPDAESMVNLRDFVADGGGLWVGLGSRTDIDSFNSDWFDGGSGMSPLALDRIVDDAAVDPPDRQSESESEVDQQATIEMGSGTRINPFGNAHPANVLLADNDQLDIGDVVIQRRFQFDSAASTSAPSVILSLSNGEPLAIEKYFGDGRVILQAIPLQMQWSTLAKSSAFVVMVREWVDYLCIPGATRFNLEPGDPIELQVTDAGSQSAMLTAPSGNAIELAGESLGDRTEFRTHRTSEPGQYWLEWDLAGNRVPFQVNRDPRESNLRSLSSNQIERLLSTTGSSAAADGNQTTVLTSEANDPVWPYLLASLVALITADLFLSGILSRDRFGTGTAVDTTIETAKPSPPSGIQSTIAESAAKVAQRHPWQSPRPRTAATSHLETFR
ncbi:hypothetical protein K227x_29920 [Rubripirellula lacrimiformis]|uniref:VWFA domain-containing protein n=1 Tax=Rubripirellula lacrimiformis TaxID=1930273 RepID=A0A517NBS5_9BACT|nr:BatA domain-containing protein [Rubripirellula lacrimiformis]QDT04599.1 hypothetical protein K227x_29920 [Rubripirellula lacrimiformis]